MGQSLAPPPYVQTSKTVRVTEHIWVIPDGRVALVPNIGIVVGNKATLVIDAGLGIRNGQATLEEARKVSRNAITYLASTHFHPEHTTGFQVFPAQNQLVRAAVQQQEVVASIQEYIDLFRKMSPVHAELLKGVRPRLPDITFERDVEVDLGGITARLFTLGPAHTLGDTFVLIKEEGVLFCGDVVTNRFYPIFPDMKSDGNNWISVTAQLAAMNPRIVIPGHGEVGDGLLITRESTLLRDLRTRTARLKREGKTVEAAVQLLIVEMRAAYPQWEAPDYLANGIRRFYADAR